MKKIITALNNPKLNEKLAQEKRIKIICKDILYKDAILDVLEKIKYVDIIFINEEIPGEINIEKLIKKIKELNNKIKIIIILKNNEKENEIKKLGIKNIYYKDEINFKNILKIINNEKIEIIEKNRNKKIKIIKNKIFKKTNKIINLLKIKNKKNNYIPEKINDNTYSCLKFPKKIEDNLKIITVSGTKKVGKSIVAIKILNKLKRKNKKILIIDLNIKKQKLYLLLNRKKYSKKIKEKINYLNRNNIKKLNLKENKLIKKFEIKINEKINLISGLDLIFKNKKIYNEREIKDFVFDFLKMYKKEYDYIIINLQLDGYKQIEREIINNSNINMIVMEANELGIENIQRILNKYKMTYNLPPDSLHIIANKYNWKCISINILKNIFGKKIKIYKLKYEKKLEKQKYYKQNFFYIN